MSFLDLMSFLLMISNFQKCVLENISIVWHSMRELHHRLIGPECGRMGYVEKRSVHME